MRLSHLPLSRLPQAFHNIGHAGHDTKNMVTLIGALCSSSGRVTPDASGIQLEVRPVHSLHWQWVHHV